VAQAAALPQMLINHQVIKQGDEVKSFMSGLVRMLSDSQQHEKV